MYIKIFHIVTFLYTKEVFQIFINALAFDLSVPCENNTSCTLNNMALNVFPHQYSEAYNILLIGIPVWYFFINCYFSMIQRKVNILLLILFALMTDYERFREYVA